jgi:glutaminase
VVSPIAEYVESLREKYAANRSGEVATYIPELAKADPEWFGIVLVTVDGCVYEAGDTAQPFTIQSISKALVYGIALEDNGIDGVAEKIGVEPTGDAFNAISLHPQTGRPSNPMINAGAIAAAGLVEGKTVRQKMNRILEALSRYAGRELSVDEAVFHSESETGHRNRAISHMLRNFGIIEGDPAPVLEAYFRQCSISVTCRDLAIMAATLANGGVNPVTGKRAIFAEYVSSVLSVMGSCGMYDYAGEWIQRVGMPAKSGVAGGIMAVLPGRLGIGVFSPRLDAQGNSVRGIEVCRDLSREMQLHLFRVPRQHIFAIRRRFDASQVSSKRIRPPGEVALLRELGKRVLVFQVQGEITFSAAETVIREITSSAGAADLVLVDGTHAAGFEPGACLQLGRLVRSLADAGKRLFFTHLEGKGPLLKLVAKHAGAPPDEISFPDNDSALEWCEDRMLHGRDKGLKPVGALSPDRFELFEGLGADRLRVLVKLLAKRAFAAGATVFEAGAPSDAMYFIARGRASIVLPLATGNSKRLATFSAGMTFGEMGVIDGAPRSARVVAEDALECFALSARDFDALGSTHPEIKVALVSRMLELLSGRLRKANAEIAILSA